MVLNVVRGVIVPNPIDLIDVNSSNIKQYGYDRKTQTLRIIFHNGVGYDYPLVNPRTWKEFQAAESKGTYLNRMIKPLYAHRKLRDFEMGKVGIKQDVELPTLAKLAEVYEEGGDPKAYFAHEMYGIPEDVEVTPLQRKEAGEAILKLSYGAGSRKNEDVSYGISHDENDSDHDWRTHTHESDGIEPVPHEHSVSADVTEEDQIPPISHSSDVEWPDKDGEAG